MQQHHLVEAGRDRRFGAPNGNRRQNGRPAGITIGKRRLRAIAQAAVLAECMNPEAEIFTGDSVDYLKSLYQSPHIPAELRFAAARAAAQFERPTASIVRVDQGGKSLEALLADAARLRQERAKVIEGEAIGAETDARSEGQVRE